MKKKTLGVLILLLAGASMLALSTCGEKDAGKGKREKEPHLVETAKVYFSDQGIVRVRTGTLRARNEVKIYTQEEGRITEMAFFEGDSVKKGDLLARLDDQLLQAQLARAKATRVQAEQDYKRKKGLNGQKLISEDELTRAQTAFEVAAADERLLATRVGYANIRSPIDGKIAQRLSEPGNIAVRYTHLLTVSDPSSLITEVTVSELLLPYVKLGDPVNVTIDALGQQNFAGRIHRIHPNLDPITRRGTIEVELTPVPEGARPGQLCRVQLQTQALQRVVMPFKALRRDTVGEYVYAIGEGDKVERTPVVSGLRLGEEVEVIDGVKAGQLVVIKGFLDLKPGTQVSVVNAEKKKTDVKLAP